MARRKRSARCISRTCFSLDAPLSGSTFPELWPRFLLPLWRKLQLAAGQMLPLASFLQAVQTARGIEAGPATTPTGRGPRRRRGGCRANRAKLSEYADRRFYGVAGHATRRSCDWASAQR
jgi:hypothetical protein